MTTCKEFNFIIDHIDPLGQGVYKENDQVYFIPKTLPGEKGRAKFLKTKKNIHFCQLITLTEKSDQRIDSECPHFAECSGCHFLHTNYANEIDFKLNSYKRMLSSFDHPEIKIIKSPKRLHYRNRIQLHRQGKTIGFHKYQTKSLVHTPQCQIFRDELKPNFNKIFNGKPIFKKHIELYWRDGSVQTSADQNYAQGGFTQVNEEVNLLMKEALRGKFDQKSELSVLDLFAGDGNLSDCLNFSHRVCMDIYPRDYQEFLNVDLYSTQAIHKLRETQFDLLLLDPPRSGFKELNQWVLKYRPKEIVYISCHPMTMVRDLKTLHSSYKIHDAMMIDLFPSTHHFEALIHLKAE
jgi:23S rRNA (uracil1939-C5)-methyltransferase